MALTEWLKRWRINLWRFMCHIQGKIRASSVSILSFLGDWLLRASKFLLTGLISAFERVGAKSSDLTMRGLWFAGAVIYAFIPSIIVPCLLYIGVWFAQEQSIIAWFVLVLGPLLSVPWILRWRHPQPFWPKAIPIGWSPFFFVASTFILLVTSYTCAYLAAAKLGGNALNFRTEVPLIGFWEYLQFSILTATTLGQNCVTTKGISCVVECIEVIQFWLFVVIIGVRFSPKEVPEYQKLAVG